MSLRVARSHREAIEAKRRNTLHVILMVEAGDMACIGNARRNSCCMLLFAATSAGVAIEQGAEGTVAVRTDAGFLLEYC